MLPVHICLLSGVQARHESVSMESQIIQSGLRMSACRHPSSMTDGQMRLTMQLVNVTKSIYNMYVTWCNSVVSGLAVAGLASQGARTVVLSGCSVTAVVA